MAIALPEMVARPLESYIRRREAQLTRDFVAEREAFTAEMGWGLKYLHLGDDGRREEPAKAFDDFCQSALQSSDGFFRPRDNAALIQTGDDLWFESPASTGSEQNDRALCRLFETGRPVGTVIVLPHWNGSRREFFPLARVFRLAGLQTIVATLPYHDERRPSGGQFDTHMVSPNVGRTLNAVRQAVAEARTLVRWARREQPGPVFLYGLSLGSAIASMAAAHEPQVAGLVLVLTAAHFADVVWEAEVTSHILSSFTGKIDLPRLRHHWEPISPVTYAHLHGRNRTPQLLIEAQYDDVMRRPNLRALLDAYEEHKVPYTAHCLPCGHQTIGTLPFSYWQAILAARFIRHCALNAQEHYQRPGLDKPAAVRKGNDDATG
jgi:pimeloyl-ACP methyl ester carboxylesterase